MGGLSDNRTTAFVGRLGMHVVLDVSAYILGIKALRRIKAEGIGCHQRGLTLDGEPPAPPLCPSQGNWSQARQSRTDDEGRLFRAHGVPYPMHSSRHIGAQGERCRSGAQAGLHLPNWWNCPS